jgi:hypothetical protein
MMMMMMVLPVDCAIRLDFTPKRKMSAMQPSLHSIPCHLRFVHKFTRELQEPSYTLISLATPMTVKMTAVATCILYPERVMTFKR